MLRVTGILHLEWSYYAYCCPFSECYVQHISSNAHSGQSAALVPHVETQRPVLSIPFFADDTVIDGLTASLLVTYLSLVKNVQQAYPFDVSINMTFACASL